jgi:hypothetical protein
MRGLSEYIYFVQLTLAPFGALSAQIPSWSAIYSLSMNGAAYRGTSLMRKLTPL